MIQACWYSLATRIDCKTPISHLAGGRPQAQCSGPGASPAGSPPRRQSVQGAGGLHTGQGPYFLAASSRVIGMALLARYLHPARWYFWPVLVTKMAASPAASALPLRKSQGGIGEASAHRPNF